MSYLHAHDLIKAMADVRALGLLLRDTKTRFQHARVHAVQEAQKLGYNAIHTSALLGLSVRRIKRIWAGKE